MFNPSKLVGTTKIYFPNIWLNLMLPIYFVFILLTPIICFYIDTMLEMEFHLEPYIFIFGSQIIFWFIAYIASKWTACYILINDKLILVHGSKSPKEYMLSKIKRFEVKSTHYSLGGAGLIKIELFFSDDNQKEYRIYSTDWGGLLNKRWLEFGKIVKHGTNKEITFSYFIEGADGKIYPQEEYRKRIYRQ
jgi:hypothetical protein